MLFLSSVVILSFLIIQSYIEAAPRQLKLSRLSRAIIKSNTTKICGIQSYTSRIRGGVIAELDEFPWMVLLMYKKQEADLEHGCGGALIETNYILTAAHCVSAQDIQRKGELKYVRLGEYNTDTVLDCIQEEEGLDCADNPLDVEIEKTIIHPDYLETSWDKHHDIAIIKLKEKVTYSDFIQPICMPRKDLDLNMIGAFLYVAGWGKTDLYTEKAVNILSPIKLKLKVPLKTHEECTRAFKQQMLNIGPGQICAGGETDRDSCPGDSGSPLMHFDTQTNRWVMVGLVSLGLKECGTPGIPGVYTKIENYIDWIEKNLDTD